MPESTYAPEPAAPELTTLQKGQAVFTGAQVLFNTQNEVMGAAFRGFTAELAEQVKTKVTDPEVAKELNELKDPVKQAQFMGGASLGLVTGFISPLTDLLGLAGLIEQLPGLAATLAKSAYAQGSALSAEAEALLKEAKDVYALAKRKVGEIVRDPRQLVGMLVALGPQVVQTAESAGRQGAKLAIGLFTSEQKEKPRESLKDIFLKRKDGESGPISFIEGKLSRLQERYVRAWAETGRKVGHAVGALVANVLLLVFSDGVGNAIAKIGGWLGEAAPLLAKGGEALVALGTRLAEVEALIAQAISKGVSLFKPLEAVLTPLFKLFGRFQTFLRRLFGVAEHGAAGALVRTGAAAADEALEKAAAGSAAPAAKPAAPKPSTPKPATPKPPVRKAPTTPPKAGSGTPPAPVVSDSAAAAPALPETTPATPATPALPENAPAAPIVPEKAPPAAKTAVPPKATAPKPASTPKAPITPKTPAEAPAPKPRDLEIGRDAPDLPAPKGTPQPPLKTPKDASPPAITRKTVDPETPAGKASAAESETTPSASESSEAPAPAPAKRVAPKKAAVGNAGSAATEEGELVTAGEPADATSASANSRPGGPGGSGGSGRGPGQPRKGTGSRAPEGPTTGGNGSGGAPPAPRHPAPAPSGPGRPRRASAPTTETRPGTPDPTPAAAHPQPAAPAPGSSAAAPGQRAKALKNLSPAQRAPVNAARTSADAELSRLRTTSTRTPASRGGQVPGWDYERFPHGPRRRWQPGDPANMPDGAGNHPSWDTVRERTWRSKAADELAARSRGQGAPGSSTENVLDPIGRLNEAELRETAKTGKMPPRVNAEIEHEGIPQRIGRKLEAAGVGQTEARRLSKLGDPNNLLPTSKDWHAVSDEVARGIQKSRNPTLPHAFDDRDIFPLGSATEQDLDAMQEAVRRAEVVGRGGQEAAQARREMNDLITTERNRRHGILPSH